MKLTPVLLVESIERSLPFWVDRMGWEKTVEVPDQGGLGFVMLTKDGAELMFQTFASVLKDEPKFAGQPGSCRSSLFFEVDDYADVLRRLDGYTITMLERTTFYGMREIGVLEPSGHVVVFATRA